MGFDSAAFVGLRDDYDKFMTTNGYNHPGMTFSLPMEFDLLRCRSFEFTVFDGRPGIYGGGRHLWERGGRKRETAGLRTAALPDNGRDVHPGQADFVPALRTRQ